MAMFTPRIPTPRNIVRSNPPTDVDIALPLAGQGGNPGFIPQARARLPVATMADIAKLQADVKRLQPRLAKFADDVDREREVMPLVEQSCKLPDTFTESATPCDKEAIVALQNDVLALAEEHILLLPAEKQTSAIAELLRYQPELCFHKDHNLDPQRNLVKTIGRLTPKLGESERVKVLPELLNSVMAASSAQHATSRKTKALFAGAFVAGTGIAVGAAAPVVAALGVISGVAGTIGIGIVSNVSLMSAGLLHLGDNNSARSKFLKLAEQELTFARGRWSKANQEDKDAIIASFMKMKAHFTSPGLSTSKRFDGIFKDKYLHPENFDKYNAKSTGKQNLHRFKNLRNGSTADVVGDREQVNSAIQNAAISLSYAVRHGDAEAVTKVATSDDFTSLSAEHKTVVMRTASRNISRFSARTQQALADNPDMTEAWEKLLTLLPEHEKAALLTA